MFFIVYNYQTNEGFITPIFNCSENFPQILLLREWMDYAYPRKTKWAIVGALAAVNESTKKKTL